MVRLGVLFVLGACAFDIRAGNGGEGTGPDAPRRDAPSDDAAIDANTSCTGFVPLGGHVSPCSVPAGGDWNVTANTTYDTTMGTVSVGTAPTSYEVGGLRIVSVTGFTIGSGSTLRVIGPKPLLVLSWDGMRIDGALDVSSRRTAGESGDDLARDHDAVIIRGA